MEIYFNLNSEGNEKIEFFSQKTYDFQILGNEALIIASYEDVELSIFQYSSGYSTQLRISEKIPVWTQYETGMLKLFNFSQSEKPRSRNKMLSCLAVT